MKPWQDCILGNPYYNEINQLRVTINSILLFKDLRECNDILGMLIQLEIVQVTSDADDPSWMMDVINPEDMCQRIIWCPTVSKILIFLNQKMGTIF